MRDRRFRLKPERIDSVFFAILLALFIAKGVIVTFTHVPFSGHDEVMHYAYLEYVATEQRLPVIPVLGDWQDADADGQVMPYDRPNAALWSYCRFTTGDWIVGCGSRETPVWKVFWPPENANYLHGWIYTANHPPLYYIYLTPVYWLMDGASLETQLYVFRLATLPFGILTVAMAWLTARTLFPRERFLALMVPAFVAFQPQISYEAVMLNNDAAAIAFTSVAIYLLVRGLKSGFPWGNVALTGFFFGLAVLSKNTSVTIGLSIAAAMILGLGVRNIRGWLPKGALAAGVAGLMVWPWFAYMYRTYGDFTALGRVSTLQYWNYANDERPTIWDQASDQGFAWWRWRETWGEFGWRLIPIGEQGNWIILRLLLWATMIAAAGVAVWAVRLYFSSRRRDEDVPAPSPDGSLFLAHRWQVAGVLTMGITCIVSYVAILQFGVSFSLTQARYYFPAIIPAALLLMIGFRAITPARWLRSAEVGLFMGMAVLNVIIYTAFVAPYWETANKVYRDIDPLFR